METFLCLYSDNTVSARKGTFDFPLGQMTMSRGMGMRESHAAPHVIVIVITRTIRRRPGPATGRPGRHGMRIQSGTIFKWTLLGLACMVVLVGMLSWINGRGARGAGLQAPRLCQPWGPMCRIHNDFAAMQPPPADMEAAKSLARNLAPSMSSLAEAVHGSRVNCEPAYRLFVMAENTLDATAQAASVEDYQTGRRVAAQAFNDGVDALFTCPDALKFGTARYDLKTMKVEI